MLIVFLILLVRAFVEPPAAIRYPYPNYFWGFPLNPRKSAHLVLSATMQSNVFLPLCQTLETQSAWCVQFVSV